MVFFKIPFLLVIYDVPFRGTTSMQGFTTNKFDRFTNESIAHFRIRGALSITTDQFDTVWVGTKLSGKGIYSFRQATVQMGFTEKNFHKVETPLFAQLLSENFPDLENPVLGRSAIMTDPHTETLR